MNPNFFFLHYLAHYLVTHPKVSCQHGSVCSGEPASCKFEPHLRQLHFSRRKLPFNSVSSKKWPLTFKRRGQVPALTHLGWLMTITLLLKKLLKWRQTSQKKRNPKIVIFSGNDQLYDPCKRLKHKKVHQEEYTQIIAYMCLIWHQIYCFIH